MDGWDVAVLVVAAYVSVMALVRLMISRRNIWVIELRQQAEAEQQRLRLIEKIAQKAAAKKKAA